MRHWRLWTALLAGAFAAGCGSRAPIAGTNAATNSEVPDAVASVSSPEAPTHGPGLPPPTPAPAVIPASGEPGPTLSQLSLELRKYVVRTKTAPKSFDDFLAKTQLQAPPAPAGKKYVIQAGAVVLVNR